jgi:hypothetical protein
LSGFCSPHEGHSFISTPVYGSKCLRERERGATSLFPLACTRAIDSMVEAQRFLGILGCVRFISIGRGLAAGEEVRGGL